MQEDVEALRERIRELERLVKISRQTLDQYAMIKRKHKEALDFLNAQKRFTDSIIESSANAIIAINHRKRVVIFNGAAEKIFGYSKKEMLNKDTLHLIVPERYYEAHNRAIERFLATGESVGIIGNRVEMEGKKRDGTLFPIRIGFGVSEKSGKTVIIANIEDITKEREQLKTIQQQNKLAAMGQMIGAIAHQWRQPLNTLSTGIQNLAFDYAEGLLEDEAYVRSFIEKNKKIIRFMSRTIDDFRAFIRVDGGRECFDVKEATLEVLGMLSAQLDYHCVRTFVEGEGFACMGMKSEYQQVVLNIVSNAQDALAQAGVEAPSIHIRFRRGQVEICDNGGGIPESVLPRIFEPYFTTKEIGKGLGLGLYMSRALIEHMGGRLEAKNEGGYACFTIYLPPCGEKE
ncbi:MAG: PAS domain S-box protein [Epsilonproteobacteria bacterium]|nr:PAS domain S-box protein [Campylobacterota bacterium]